MSIKSKSKKSTSKADSIKAMREATFQSQAGSLVEELETNVFPMHSIQPAPEPAEVETKPAPVEPNQTQVGLMSQKDAVLSAISQVLGTELVEGVKVTLTPEQFIMVQQRVMHGFTDRAIALKPTPSNEAKLFDELLLASYVKGLVINWLGKSKLLNGKSNAK